MDACEVEVSGLPLALMEGGAYDEVQVRGTHFAFVSDGVVEAASETGELFGFERTTEVITQSAAKITEVAKAWGQNDVITVVTVRMAG